MPYKLEKRENEWCVINKDTGENKGCSSTRSKAVGHMRVLYAAEAGEVTGSKSLDEFVDMMVGEAVKEADEEYGPDLAPPEPIDTTESKSINERPESNMPFIFATSYADLEKAKNAAEQAVETEELIRQFPMLALNVMNDPNIKDKEAGINKLAGELANRVQSITKKEIADEQKQVEYDEEEDGLDVKAKWSTAYKNDLPNSAFLYVEPDCDKASCRHFPYKDKAGNIDLTHLRNALSRLGDSSNVPSLKGSKRKSVIAKAERILKNAQKKELSGVAAWVKDTWNALFSKQEQPVNKSFMVWKDKNQWLWLARYSNNFRDRDIPPEIISEASHKKFVEKVEKGLAPYPELWLWHVPDWKIGQSTWVAYDDSGFAMAAGYFNKGCEPVAKWLSEQEDVLVSHGMPPTSIKREPNDKSIIIEHESREISPLPSWFAANALTDFVTLEIDNNKEASQMAIPDAKKTILEEEWGMPPELIQGIEALNAATADQAVKEGLERKDTDEPNPEQTTTDAEATEQPQSDEQETKDQDESQETPEVEDNTQTEEATTEEEVKETEEKLLDEPPSRREVADSFAPLLKELFEEIKSLKETVEALSDKATALEEKDKEATEELIANTPLASLAALMNKGVRGSEEARVDGRTTLAKQKPQETDADAKPATNVQFINDMLSAKPADAVQ